MAGGGSKLAVYTAIGANSLVTVAKVIGFVLTGSGAMLSEAIHSVADVGNQSLLAFGMKKAEKPPDEAHPMGYGREAFVWSIISAVGIFFLGCGFTVMHGVQALLDSGAHGGGHGEESSMLGIYILIFALVIEGGSLGVALRGMGAEAKERGMSLVQHLKTTDDPFGIAVLLEDSAAVLGVLMALAAIGLARFTHSPMWDAIGSISIGLLLGGVAVFLIAKNRALLIGRAVHGIEQKKIQDILEKDPAVEAVAVQKSVVMGTTSYQISAEIDFDGKYIARTYLEGRDIEEIYAGINNSEEFVVFLEDFGEEMMVQVGKEVDRIEDAIRKKVPKAQHLDIEAH